MLGDDKWTENDGEIVLSDKNKNCHDVFHTFYNY